MRRLLVHLGRRAAAGVATIVGMLTIAFILFWATHPQPARFIFPFTEALTPYQVSHGNHVLGADKPKLDQWAHDVSHVVRGDFGTSWAQSGPPDATGRPTGYAVAARVDPSLRVTLSLLLGGAAFVLLLAVPLGAYAGSRVGTLGDRTVSLLALLGVCTHPMVVGILVRSLFANRLHWLPPTGYCPLVRPHGAGCGGVVDWADHLVLPWLTFALLFLALYVRMVRAGVAETVHEDYVRTARAKGAREARVIARHVLPNVTLRVLTMIGMEIGTAIGVSIYIETAYQLPGLATTAVQTLAGQNGTLDLPVVLAVVFLISVIVVAGNLVVDTLYVYIDPRGRGAAEASKPLAGGVI